MHEGRHLAWGAASPRRRAAFLVALAGALTLYFTLVPHAPHDQTLHVVLGNASARVTEVDLRYAANEPRHEGTATRTPKADPLEEDWTRAASFRYALGAAPRVVTHEPRLPDGDYVLEIEVVSGVTPQLQNGPTTATTTLRRTATLHGGAVSIDVAASLP